MHHMAATIPVIKIAYYADTECIWCPDCECSSFHTINFHRMSSKLLICMIKNTCTESFFFCFCNLSRKCIRIRKCPDFFSSGNAILICRDLSSRNHCRKVTGIILFLHLICLFIYKNFCLLCIRKKSLDQNTICSKPRCHQIFRRCFFCINNCFNLRPVHIFIYFAFHNSCLHSEIQFSNCIPLF